MESKEAKEVKETKETSETKDMYEIKDTNETKALSIVNKYMFGSIVTGFIPIPSIDFAALAVIQLAMLRSIAKIYKVEFNKNIGKLLIGSLVGSGTSRFFSMGLTSLFKKVPVVGQAVGLISGFVTSGASTYALGKVFIMHFESGGTLLTFNPSKVKAFYLKILKESDKTAGSCVGRQP